MAPDELGALRAQLAQVDQSLRRAVGRRLALARAIGRVKQREGLPIRNLPQERTVVARWQEGLEKEGVPADRAEALARWLVEEAVRAQEAPTFEGLAPLPPQRIVIVGGAGAMGRWMANHLAGRGHRITLVDPKAPRGRRARFPVARTLREAVDRAQVILVATPMQSAASVYGELLRARPTGLILDVLSVKRPLLAAIRLARRRGLHVASLHPLFGPSADTLSGRVLLVLDCGDPGATREAEILFAGTPLTRIRLPIARHDRLMANLQALPRMVGLLFVAALSAGDPPTQELERLGPPSFQRQAGAARHVVEEDAALSFDILALNAYRTEVLGHLRKGLRDLERILHAQDPTAFARLVRSGRRTLGSSGGAPRPGRGAAAPHGERGRPGPTRSGRRAPR